MHRWRQRRPAAPVRSCLRGAAATLLALTAFGAARPAAAQSGPYYISPSGQDSNDGRSEAKPLKTFARAFSVLPAGGTLVLLDGTYSVALGTGIISYLGTGSGQVPSGSAAQPTQVVALHPGSVFVNGVLFVGRSTRKDSYIRISGITFQAGAELYNTSYVTVKDCGFHGAFNIGTNDHNLGNTRNLVEDVWIWATGERLIASNYRAHENVWRRVVVRGDGCGTAACNGEGNPNVGITVYDSHDVSLQNVIVLDRVLASGDEPYADFALAQHAVDSQYFAGRNAWLGTLSLRSPDSGFLLEPDAVVDPTTRVENAVAWDARVDAFNLARKGSLTLRNLTARAITGDGLRVAPELTSGSLVNVLVAGAGRYGVNSAIKPSYVDVYGAATAYNQTTCSTGCYTTNAQTGGALRYLTRIEAGSFLSGRGAGGADIGATIVNRYGIDGSRFADAGYDTLTANALWPWPNEGRIKSEMCQQSGVARGFCAASSLSAYVWGYLGNDGPRGLTAWNDWFAVDPLETPYVGDFNGDGKTDIITFTRQNPLAVGDVYVALSDGARFGASAKWNDWFAVTTDETVVIGDFDGDGKDDIATWLGKTTHQVYVALSTGAGMTPATVWAGSIGFDPTDVVVAGDVNGDKKQDLVCFARKQGKVYVALSDGKKFATPVVWHGFFAVSTYERPRVADVNGDGKADIVTFATNSPTAFGDVYVATSDGTKFVDQNGTPNSSSKWHDWFAIDQTQEIRIGDLDGDGKDDFFTFLPPPWGQCYTVRSQGTSMAANVLWPEIVVLAGTDRPFVGDANGDGKADIIVFAQHEGRVFVSLAK